MGHHLKTYLLVTEKRWHDQLFNHLKSSSSEIWHRIGAKTDFTAEKLAGIKPDLIFIPHWSYIIPSTIFENYTCILFHMTDLPFGRGGSPLQNLITGGFEKTVISAIRVTKDVDAGDIYLKRELSLMGTAEEIFIRSADVIGSMIADIIANDIQPTPQKGEIHTFKRRSPEDSNINQLTDLRQLYDYIRMLDCEGYPKAYLETSHFRFEFSRGTLKAGETILADVRITKK